MYNITYNSVRKKEQSYVVKFILTHCLTMQCSIDQSLFISGRRRGRGWGRSHVGVEVLAVKVIEVTIVEVTEIPVEIVAVAVVVVVLAVEWERVDVEVVAVSLFALPPFLAPLLKSSASRMTSNASLEVLTVIHAHRMAQSGAKKLTRSLQSLFFAPLCTHIFLSF